MVKISVITVICVTVNVFVTNALALPVNPRVISSGSQTPSLDPASTEPPKRPLPIPPLSSTRPREPRPLPSIPVLRPLVPTAVAPVSPVVIPPLFNKYNNRYKPLPRLPLGARLKGQIKGIKKAVVNVLKPQKKWDESTYSVTQALGRACDIFMGVAYPAPGGLGYVFQLLKKISIAIGEKGAAQGYWKDLLGQANLLQSLINREGENVKAVLKKVEIDTKINATVTGLLNMTNKLKGSEGFVFSTEHLSELNGIANNIRDIVQLATYALAAKSTEVLLSNASNGQRRTKIVTNGGIQIVGNNNTIMITCNKMSPVGCVGGSRLSIDPIHFSHSAAECRRTVAE